VQHATGLSRGATAKAPIVELYIDEALTRR